MKQRSLAKVHLRREKGTGTRPSCLVLCYLNSAGISISVSCHDLVGRLVYLGDHVSRRANSKKKSNMSKYLLNIYLVKKH